MALPPGPRIPEALQTIEWMARPTAFLRRCGERYGDVFTIRVSTTGRADGAHSGTPTRSAGCSPSTRTSPAAARAPRRSSRSSGRGRSCCSTAPSTCASAGSSCRRCTARRCAPGARSSRELAERELASWPRGRPVATLPRMRALTLEVVLRLVFGARDRAEVEPLRAAIERPLQITSSLPRLLGLARGMQRPWQMFDARRARARRRGRDARSRGGAPIRRRAPCWTCCSPRRDEDGSPLSDGELRDQLVTLLAAGHETTASGLAWAFERLSRHPRGRCTGSARATTPTSTRR